MQPVLLVWKQLSLLSVVSTRYLDSQEPVEVEQLHPEEEVGRLLVVLLGVVEDLLVVVVELVVPIWLDWQQQQQRRRRLHSPLCFSHLDQRMLPSDGL